MVFVGCYHHHRSLALVLSCVGRLGVIGFRLLRCKRISIPEGAGVTAAADLLHLQWNSDQRLVTTGTEKKQQNFSRQISAFTACVTATHVKFA